MHMGNKTMRLDRYISSQRTDLSRSDVKKLIKAGRITVNGRAVKSADYKVDTETDEVYADGQKIIFREHLYIMLNKPQGYVCSTKEGASPTVLELLPEELRRSGLFPAGRLDKDTEGFVLITDDGELAHNMLAPSRHVPKTYYVRLEKPYSKKYEKIFSAGAVIDGVNGNTDVEKCLPAECFADPADGFACTLVLREGRFHQVKRMFESVGNKVIFLKRIRIGSLELDETLASGECLEIMHKDVEKLLCR